MSPQIELQRVIEDAFNRPLVPHEPEKQSLKQWSMFVLRDKGFRVVYTQNADFAIERGGEKLYFKVTNIDEVKGSPAVQRQDLFDQELDEQFSWVIWDSRIKSISVVLAKN
jgi:hypothetical protein